MSNQSGDDRVRRLEEHAAFNEHTVEQLSGEIAELNKRLAILLKRIDTLENRLGTVLDRLEDSAGEGPDSNE